MIHAVKAVGGAVAFHLLVIVVRDPCFEYLGVLVAVGISKATLQRRARRPVAGEIDPNDAKPGIIGGRRFWLRDNVLALAGIKPTKRVAR